MKLGANVRFTVNKYNGCLHWCLFLLVSILRISSIGNQLVSWFYKLNSIPREEYGSLDNIENMNENPITQSTIWCHFGTAKRQKPKQACNSSIYSYGGKEN